MASLNSTQQNYATSPLPVTLTPRQVITGKDYEPYAILTDLGWSIVGYSTPSLDETETSLCHRVTLKELPPVTPIYVLSVLESDFKDTKGDNKTSQDLIFLSKLKEGIKKNEQGHLEMPLPSFRLGNVILIHKNAHFSV